MDPKQAIQTSKFLSLVLRHEPHKIGITLDSAGWVGVRELLDAIARHRSRGGPLSNADLRAIVATSDKKRFELSEDGTRIRASQGHSVEVNLGYAPQVPPDALLHGTVAQFLDSIRHLGLIKGQRHHVHLSADLATAQKVGQRRGRPVVLTIRAGEMHADGHTFFLSSNHVWLTEHVPEKYIEFPADA